MAVTGEMRYADSGFAKPYDPGHDNVDYVDLTVGGTVTTLAFSSGAGLPTGTAPISSITVHIRAWMSEGFANNLSFPNTLTLKYKTFTLTTLTPTATTTAGTLGFNPGAWNSTNPETGLAWTTTELFSANNFTVVYNRAAGGNALNIGVLECYVVVDYSNLPNASITPSSGTSGDTITVSGGGLHGFIYVGGNSGSQPTAGVYVFDGNVTYSAAVTVNNDDSLTFQVPAGWTAGATIVYIQPYDGSSVDSIFIHFPSSAFTTTAAQWWFLPNSLDDFGQFYYSVGQPADVTINFVTYSWRTPVNGDPGWDSGAGRPLLGWWRSVDDFSGEPITISTGRPKNPRMFTEIVAFATGATNMLGGMPGAACVSNNKMIYPAGGYVVGTDYPTIRIYDGLFDRLLCQLPPTAAGGVPKAVMSMIAANGTVYLSTLDSGSSSADWLGRVFKLDIELGTLTPIGATFTAGHIPYALAWHMGRLWCGTHRQSSTAAGKIFYFRPNQDTAWTDDHTLSTESMANCTSLCSFAGQLYVGCSAAALTFAKILVRDSAGAYTTSDTGSGGAATANNCFPYMLEYSGALYASYWNNDSTAIAKIRKLSGGAWSTSYTGASGTLRPFFGMLVDNGNLYAIGGSDSLLGAVVTYNGSAWTDLSAFLTNNSVSYYAQPVFGVIVL